MKTTKTLILRRIAAAVSALSACTAFAFTAFADEAAAASNTSDGQQQVSAGSAMGQLLLQLAPFIIALVLLYLIMLRPQQKREKQAQAMRENVRVGDEVCTAGGIVGIVLKVNDDSVVLETGGERNKIRIKKWAIHENITQVEAKQQEEKERKARRTGGMSGLQAAEADEAKKKKKKNADD